jgi:peptidoglycan/LPS O-acetylase OafA/YrhL
VRAVDGDNPANVKSVEPVDAVSHPEKPPVAAKAEPAPSRWKNFFALDLLDNRHPSLHGLRFFAVLTVLQYHVTFIYQNESAIFMDPRWYDASTTVFFGMDCFFFLSGFLIGAILLRSIEVAKTQNVKRFYLRRIFRTFPSYYLVLTFLACAFPITQAQHHHLIYEYVYGTNYTTLRQDQVIMYWGWSLALEEQFYLTVPIFVFVLNRLRSDRGRAILLVAIWLSALVVRLVYYYTHIKKYGPFTDLALYDQIYFRTKTRFDPLVAGILLAFIQHRWKEPVGRWLQRPANRALLALPTLTCFWLLIDPLMFGPQNLQLMHLFLWGTVTSIFYMGVVLLLLHGNGWIPQFFSLPIFRKVATLGYGVYLVHIPIVYHVLVPIARRLYYARTPMVLLWPASLAALVLLSLAVGYVLHIFVEKPSLRMRDRMTA